MYNRQLLNTLHEDLAKMPVVVLFGPRQVGKTTLAKQLLAKKTDGYIYLDMELPQAFL